MFYDDELKEMSNEEIVQETIRIQKQTEKLIKATMFVVYLTIIAVIIKILIFIGVIPW